MLGLEIDGASQGMVARLNEKGARVKGSVVRDKVAGNFVHLEDPDGNRDLFVGNPPARCARAGTRAYLRNCAEPGLIPTCNLLY